MSTLTGTATPTHTVGSRARWLVADGLNLVGRELRRLQRGPDELISSLLFPSALVLLFGYVIGSAITVPGSGDYREYLMPGLFTMAMVTSNVGLMTRVAADFGRGVIDRFRAMAIARFAVPFGQSIASTVNATIGLIIMTVAALIVGWRPHGSAADTVAAFLLLLLLGYALSWVGVYLGLTVKSEQAASQLVPLLMPVTMISNAFVPTDGMPTWLGTIADWNPVSALTGASRELFQNPGVAGGPAAPWPVAHPVVATILWSVALIGVFLPLAVRTYTRKSR